jgi:hypothetical protein
MRVKRHVKHYRLDPGLALGTSRRRLTHIGALRANAGLGFTEWTCMIQTDMGWA